MEVRLLKQGCYLIPFDSETEEWLNIKHDGHYFSCTIVTPRNYQFHKKFFALLNVTFPYWNPEPLNTRYGVAEKNFKIYRKDLTIMAGFYDMVIRLNGEAKPEAKSISFAAMDENQFAVYYNACVNVIIKRVLVGWTIERVDEEVGRFL